MSNTDTMIPLVTATWAGRSGEQLLTYPLPALGHPSSLAALVPTPGCHMLKYFIAYIRECTRSRSYGLRQAIRSGRRASAYNIAKFAIL